MSVLTNSVYVVGPSSTGKTTLCRAFATRIGLGAERVVSEVARSVMQARGFTRNDLCRLEMQEAILNAVLEKYEDDSTCLPRIHDRSAIDPVVYAVLTAKDPEEATLRKEVLMNTEKFQSALVRYRQSTVILLKPIREWIVDDGIRSIEDTEKCYEMFKIILGECGIRYHEIGAEMAFLEERVAWVAGLCMR